jgi:hypothetical protein
MEQVSSIQELSIDEINQVDGGGPIGAALLALAMTPVSPIVAVIVVVGVVLVAVS